jgi:hypothetical protein
MFAQLFVAVALPFLATPVGPPSTFVPIAAQPDSGYLVEEPGGWTFRGGALAFGPYKATRIREHDREVKRRGNILLGARHETWRTEFDLPQSPVEIVGRTTCHLDRLVDPGMDVRRRLGEQHLFRMDCSVKGDAAWELSIAAGLPPADPGHADPGNAEDGIPIGAFSTGTDEWSLVANGAQRIVAALWTHPHSLRFRAPDGSVDAEVFVRDRRRVWINPHLPQEMQATLARAAVALLVAGPLVAADDIP